MRIDGTNIEPPGRNRSSTDPIADEGCYCSVQTGKLCQNIVANQFGVHKSTVKKFVYCFCKGMVLSVIHSLIKVPTAEEACAIARRFEQKFSIPQIIGCIDGTHIPVLPPSDGYKDFVIRKGWPSYVLQAVVDDMYR